MPAPCPDEQSRTKRYAAEVLQHRLLPRDSGHLVLPALLCEQVQFADQRDRRREVLWPEAVLDQGPQQPRRSEAHAWRGLVESEVDSHRPDGAPAASPRAQKLGCESHAASQWQSGAAKSSHRCMISGLEVRDRSTLASGMSRTTPSREPIAHAMTTDDAARARQRAKRLNEQRRSQSFSWAVRELPDGRFEVVALAKG